MNDLKACPCGKTPKQLGITETLSGKWAYVVGDCCGEWTIEYRNGYAKGKEQEKLAEDAWNESPRARNDVIAKLEKIDEAECSIKAWDLICNVIESMKGGSSE